MRCQIGLLAKLDDISLPKKMPWIEKLDFVTNEPLELEDAQDDLKREAALYVPHPRCHIHPYAIGGCFPFDTRPKHAQ